MAVAYDITNRSVSGVSTQPALRANSFNKGGYLLIALGIIVLIGSLVATGCLYSRLGYSSLAIGGAGVVVCILSFLLSKYCRTPVVAERRQPAVIEPQVFDFTKVKPSNIFEIFPKGGRCNTYGDVALSDRISHDESKKFTQNFPHKYKIEILDNKEKNEHGYNNYSCYTFMMNDEGKVESYGKVFDNFDLYLEYMMHKSSGYVTFDHFDFHVDQTIKDYKILRKVPSK